MECLRSSHSASSTSCNLRMNVRSWVRNRFLASCWVSVEPPCDDAAMQDVGHGRARDADGIDAVMRIEAAVLDGDESLRQIGRQFLQRDIGAGHFAARRQHAAVEADDLDRRRPFRDFKRLDRRQMRADPDHDADHRDHGPQAEYRAPVEPAGRGRCGPRALDLRLPLAPACARLALARRSSSASLALRLGGWLLFRLVVAAGHAVLRTEAQLGSAMRRARIAAPCVRCSFSVPTPYANAAHTGPAAR